MPTLFASTDAGFTAEQAAGSLLDYGLDWADFLSTAPGDSIASSTWTAEDPLALTISNQAVAGAITSAWLTGGQAGQWYAVVNEITTVAGRRDSRVCMLYVRPALSGGSALFPSRLVALTKLRRDRLVMAAAGALPEVTLTDDYLWDKLLAAEADASRELQVFFEPTKLFPDTPTPEEISALDGKPWAVDPGYDYDQDLLQPGGWTFIALRKKPVVSLESIKFVFPSSGVIYTVPETWTKVDKKYGHVRFIPNGSAFTHPMGGMLVHTMGMQTAPQFVEIRYTAGLSNAAAEYPDLLDLVQRMAVLGLLGDAMLPTSGSISADGLSQSVSPPDMEKLRGEVDRMLDTLRTRLHGVKMMVL